jgi:hypothetical protein
LAIRVEGLKFGSWCDQEAQQIAKAIHIYKSNPIANDRVA